MTTINENLISFKEFYVLEEGIGSSIIEKFRDLKTELMTKDLDGNPINTKRIHSLSQEILELLKALGRLNKDIFKRFADMIINDPLLRKNRKRIPIILTAIIHLLAIYGAKTFNDNKQARFEKRGPKEQYQQVVQDIEKETPRFFWRGASDHSTKSNQ